MNKYEIKETDVNMYEYRGYTISGNDRIGYVCISPYGAFSPKAYNTIEDAKAAIDDDLDCIAEKYGEQQTRAEQTPPIRGYIMNKALIVEKELYFLLHAANDDVDDITYCEDNGEEWVLVTMKNGHVYDIGITGDSPLAAAKDVITVMMYK